MQLYREVIRLTKQIIIIRMKFQKITYHFFKVGESQGLNYIKYNELIHQKKKQINNPHMQ